AQSGACAAASYPPDSPKRAVELPIPVARIVLHRDPVAEELRSRRCWQSHLERAQWLSREGYRKILEQAVANKV
ncbi:hypothetical protein, partial [Pseudomonas aeruginosa]|uniref:hypothetical protein n=1 Tax=Pseudomonas aeruginosa TaxID=287 RepID=UPI00209E3D70